jgi:N-glycosylase/DNA lyase
MRNCQIELNIESFNPAFTFNSGQVFRWKSLNDNYEDWLGVVEGNVIRIKNRDVLLLGQATNSSDFGELVPRYFSIADNLAEILSSFPQDDLFLKSSISEFPGLRLLTQDPWECLISFVCSINCNIPSIKLKLENLSKMFGEKIHTGMDEKCYSFPSPRALSRAEKKDLLSCKLGFRWKYVQFIAKQVQIGKLDLDRVSSMNYSEAVDELISEVSGKTFGVGPKVADCVLLYSFHLKEAFPLDVWILKYVQEIYGENQAVGKSLSRKNYKSIGEIMRKKFGSNAGYAQLFIYEKIRRRSAITRNTMQA